MEVTDIGSGDWNGTIPTEGDSPPRWKYQKTCIACGKYVTITSGRDFGLPAEIEFTSDDVPEKCPHCGEPFSLE